MHNFEHLMFVIMFIYSTITVFSQEIILGMLNMYIYMCMYILCAMHHIASLRDV